MGGPSVASHEVSVRRWRSVHLVAADHPAPAQVKQRLDDALRASFDRAVADRLGRGLGEGSGRAFVRRLEIDVAVDVSWGCEEIVGAWSAAFARSLLHELATGPGHNVVRFPTDASWLGSYIVDRATGGAGAWFHRAFDGWAALASSAAIRSALCEDREMGLQSLRELSLHARAAIVSALGEADARAVVTRLARPDGSTVEGVSALLQSVAEDAALPNRLSAPGLAVWFLAENSDPSLKDVEIAVRILRNVPAVLSERPQIHASELLAALSSDSAVQARCINAAREPAEASLHAVMIELANQMSSPTAVNYTQRSTSRGGGFLLLDDLPGNELEVAVGSWPPLAGVSPATVLRALILGRCLSDDSFLLFDDDCWRDLCGIHPATSRESVAKWLLQPRSAHVKAEAASMIEKAAACTLQRFSQRLPGFSDSSAGFLRVNFLSQSASLVFEPDRIAVTLSRAPLDLILNISGRSRGERRSPWLDPRPFVLFQGD